MSQRLRGISDEEATGIVKQVFDTSKQCYDELRNTIEREFLRQAGDCQRGERGQHDDVFNPLGKREALVIGRGFLRH